MKKKLQVMLLLMCCLFVMESSGQTVKISGTVKDVEGERLPGVNIQLKGSKVAAVSDNQGGFNLDAPARNAVLIFSYIGYATKAVTVNNSTNLNVVLERSSNDLDQVVVVGYTTVRKGDLTGAVGQVNMESLSKAPVASFDDALAGRVAGVSVSSNDGQPGSSPEIVIRGAGSLTQNISPIYVVDGFVLENFSPSALSPQDIESITVLKDASATAIYGSRGANGVIVVTTKMGKIGRPTVNYSLNFGLNNATKRMELMDSYEFVKLQIERFPDQARSSYYSGIPIGDPMDPEIYRNAPTINWQDKVLRTGQTQIHNLSISGGSATTKYLASMAYYKQNGTLINTSYDKINGRLMLNQTISKNVSLSINTIYSNQSTSGIIPTDPSLNGYANSSFFFSVYGYRPLSGLSPEDNLSLENELIDEDPNINGASDYRLNPVVMAQNEDVNAINNMFIPSVNLNVKFNKQLSLVVRGGLDYRDRENNYFYNSKTRIGIQRPGVSYAGIQGGVSQYKYSLLSNENVLTYNESFADKHKLEGQLGFSIQKVSTQTHSLRYQEIPYEELGLSGIDLGVPMPGESRLAGFTGLSVFGRINYNLLSRYLFTFTMRGDASSKFPVQNRWGYFPSGAFAWRVSAEPFMASLTWLDDFKIRSSYGTTGNNRVGEFDRFAQLTTPYSGYYSFNNGTPLRGAERSTLGNSELRWETTTQTNLGADISILKQKVNLTLDLYRKTTKDLLLKANLPTISGFSNAMKNVGSIKNEGVEITLSTTNIKTPKFSWTTDFNIGMNRNKVLSLNGEEPVMFSTVSWDSQFNNSALYQARVGGPVSEFWGVKWDGIYQIPDFTWQNGSDPSIPHESRVYLLKDGITTNGRPRDKMKPGDIKYVDMNGDLTVNADDRVGLGNAIPKHTGGFGNTFTFGNFMLNAFFQWSYGQNIFNANRIMFEGGYNIRPLQNQFASYQNRWTIDNQTNEMFRAGLGGSESGAGPNGVYSDYTIEDGSFLRLKTIALEYKLPANVVKKLQAKNINIGLSAQNIKTWTSYSGLDPEVSTRNSILTPGFDYSSYPRAFTLVFNANITF